MSRKIKKREIPGQGLLRMALPKPGAVRAKIMARTCLRLSVIRASRSLELGVPAYLHGGKPRQQPPAEVTA